MKQNIIGQENLISEIEKILQIFTHSECEIRPHFILTGESGSGKTLTIKTLAEAFKISFIVVNAAQLTKEGTSGNSVSKALGPLLQLGNRPSIVFVDEFDKLFISGNSNSELAHESSNGVQNEFLKILEGDQTSVFGDYGKYVPVSTKNCLFIFAGAFNNETDITIDRLREFGIKTEFLGRVGLVFNTTKMTLEGMFRVLETSPLFGHYLKLFTGVDKEQAELELKGYIQRMFEKNTLGSRMVNTILHQYFIKGGLPTENEMKKVTFQKTLEFTKHEGTN